MRAALRWALGMTLVLSAAALWWQPAAQFPLISATPRSTAATPPGRDLPALAKAAGAGRLPGPEAMSPWELEPAARDIFAPGAPMQPPTPPPIARAVPPPVAAQVPPPPAPPAMPPVQMRYLGSMRSPGGERLVLLARGEQAFVARAGMGFEDGYAIQSVGPQSVRVVHASSGAYTDIAIPAAFAEMPAHGPAVADAASAALPAVAAQAPQQ